MTKIIVPFFLLSVLVLFGTAQCLAGNCSEAQKIVDAALTKPPAADTEATFTEAFKQCPDDPKLYDLVGDYYRHWWKNDINPENQAYYNYLATEYYAEGIKAGQDDEVKTMRYKLAALESGVDEITAVGIRSIKPGARLNIKVMFEFNSSELTSGAQEQLDVLGRYLAEGSPSRIILEGHTDMAGPEAYNMALSLNRAESAKQYLVRQFSVTPDSIETIGYGFDRLVDVDDPFNAKNRRVRVRKLPVK